MACHIDLLFSIESMRSILSQSAYWLKLKCFRRRKKRQSVKAFKCILPYFFYVPQFSPIVMMFKCTQFCISMFLAVGWRAIFLPKKRETTFESVGNRNNFGIFNVIFFIHCKHFNENFYACSVDILFGPSMDWYAICIMRKVYTSKWEKEREKTAAATTPNGGIHHNKLNG